MGPAFRGPAAWVRALRNVPDAAASWPTYVLSSAWTDSGGRTRHVTGYRVRAGADVWPAWLLVRPGWRREDADRVLRQVDEYDARGVVLNPEAGWLDGHDDEAARLVDYFRDRAPAVAVCSYPRADLHPRFPWAAFSRARIGLAETYANRGQPYTDEELARCLASWRAVGFAEVHPMVGMFDRSNEETRIKPARELAVDLRQRPASESCVWGPSAWPRAQSALLSAWGAGRPLPSTQGPGGAALLLLAAAGAGALWALRGGA